MALRAEKGKEKEWDKCRSTTKMTAGKSSPSQQQKKNEIDRSLALNGNDIKPHAKQ